MRKLASIQLISNLQPHPNADKLEIATILGWTVVVQKDQFNIGDKVVYLEYDSVTPDKPEFEFLRRVQFRIKTLKLRGVISQGVAIPTHIFNLDHLPVGTDVTELLGITKYEPPTLNKNQFVGVRPGFIPRTDEVRIQAQPELLDELAKEDLYVTEKLEGESCTFYYIDGKFGICSREMELKDTEDSPQWKLAREGIKEKIENYGDGYAFQGELIGPGIQGNIYKLKKHEFRLFNIINLKSRERFGFQKLSNAASELGFKLVPILHSSFRVITCSDKQKTIRALVDYSNGYSCLDNAVKREGVVIRTLDGTRSFKVISPEYLL